MKCLSSQLYTICAQVSLPEGISIPTTSKVFPLQGYKANAPVKTKLPALRGKEICREGIQPNLSPNPAPMP